MMQEYLQPLEELQFKNRLEVGAVLRELRLTNIQCKFEAEQLATEQNFQVSKLYYFFDDLSFPVSFCPTLVPATLMGRQLFKHYTDRVHEAGCRLQKERKQLSESLRSFLRTKI